MVGKLRVRIGWWLAGLSLTGVVALTYRVTRTHEPFQFLDRLQMAEPPDTRTYDGAWIYIYSGQIGYQSIYSQAKAELTKAGWYEESSGMNDRYWKVLFCRDSPEGPGGSFSICIVRDKKWSKDGWADHTLATGWTTVSATLKSPEPTAWDKLRRVLQDMFSGRQAPQR